MSDASFTVDVTAEDAIKFAQLSGDWNPLHTDAEYASKTIYKTPVLHGAFSAGLISQMAGMHLPGKGCLLHSIQLRFIAPIIPPVTLSVTGNITRSSEPNSHVEVVIADQKRGTRYIVGSYEYGHHKKIDLKQEAVINADLSEPVTVVTGATGGIGKAVLNVLGKDTIGLSRHDEQFFIVPEIEFIGASLPKFPIRGIVHCAWEAPDNVRFVDLDLPEQSIETHVVSPLRQIQALAKLLIERGTPGATLILIGSTWAEPGRHAYRTPLYSIAKSMIPVITRILAMELAAKNMRCVGLKFDVIDGGMNDGISDAARVSNADRMPSGQLATPDEVAGHIKWIMENESMLASGAMIDLSGGSIP